MRKTQLCPKIPSPLLESEPEDTGEDGTCGGTGGELAFATTHSHEDWNFETSSRLDTDWRDEPL